MDQYQEMISVHPELYSNDNAMIRIITDEFEILAWETEQMAKLRSEGKPEEWGTIGIVYQDPYILIIRDLVEFPNGKRSNYSRIIGRANLRGGQGVVVLAEMEGKYLILRQFRHPIRAWSYEVPRGFGEADISPEQQAYNEVQEEAGGEIIELTNLGLVNSNTGLEGSSVKLFHAKLKSVGQPETNEGIEKFVWVSLEELELMISKGEIKDCFTIAAYTRAKLVGKI